MFEHFRGDWAYAEPNFFDELSKFFFFKIFTLVLLDGSLDGFWKFRLFIVKICILIWYFWVFFENYSWAEHTRKRFCSMLSILGTDFIAHWAYEERISAHAQPAVKCEQLLHVQYMLSIRGTNFIAHWAYAERISSHAEHTRNRFHRMLSMRWNVQKSNISAESNTIFKNLVLQALGTIWFRFLQKKSKNFVHACVPLILNISWLYRRHFVFKTVKHRVRKILRKIYRKS
jgi:hypothetical protein